MKFISKFLFALAVLSAITTAMETGRPLPLQVILDRQTKATDWGKNEIFYLDRQHVKCAKDEALQGFQLTRPKKELLAYKYACRNIGKGDSYETKTKLNAVNDKNLKKSANFLDRHHPKCKPGYGIQKFALGRDDMQIYYKYTCVKVDCESKIHTKKTKKTIDGGFETIYLDRQGVNVLTDEIITGFRLHSHEGKFWYEVNFCRLNYHMPKPIIIPPPKKPFFEPGEVCYKAISGFATENAGRSCPKGYHCGENLPPPMESEHCEIIKGKKMCKKYKIDYIRPTGVGLTCVPDKKKPIFAKYGQVCRENFPMSVPRICEPPLVCGQKVPPPGQIFMTGIPDRCYHRSETEEPRYLDYGDECHDTLNTGGSQTLCPPGSTCRMRETKKGALIMYGGPFCEPNIKPIPQVYIPVNGRCDFKGRNAQCTKGTTCTKTKKGSFCFIVKKIRKPDPIRCCGFDYKPIPQIIKIDKKIIEPVCAGCGYKPYITYDVKLGKTKK